MRRRGRAGRGAGGPQPRRIRRFLEPALLLVLHCNPAHGYALVEGLRDLGLESYPADLSAVYRVLYDLEGDGLLVSRRESKGSGGPPRRVYELTQEGDAYLKTWVDELRETERLLHRFLQAYDEHEEFHRDEPRWPDGLDRERDTVQPEEDIT